MEPALAELVVCETCGGSERELAGQRLGAILRDRVREALAVRSDARVALTSVRCLWACTQSCAVMLRSNTRVGYVIARLEPSDDTASALLDYASMYVASEEGAVPYKLWPPALKGHFLCRIPRATPSGEPPAGALDPHPEGSGLAAERREPAPEQQAKIT
jgi:predicted metal-binding protein